LQDDFTTGSLEGFLAQGWGIQSNVPFNPETAFVIDGGPLLLAFGRNKEGELNPNYAVFYFENGQALLANYHFDTFFKKFLKHDPVWAELSKKFETILVEQP